MSYQSVAEQLLEAGFLLTALELHVELAERGQELATLKSFFQNPTNFERYTRKMSPSVPPSPCLSQASVEGLKQRRGSQNTLDSTSWLEMTRYSEDSHVQNDDQMAVLEFELRKARQTIHSLRGQLTDQAAKLQESFHPQVGGGAISGEVSHLSVISDQAMEGDEDEMPAIRSHERRAINYLVNEYLLQQGYKLTSITFSDENSDEDYEDWDSIGLNVAKPPNLLRLFRDFGQHVMPEKDVRENSTQTQEPFIEPKAVQGLERTIQTLEGANEALREDQDHMESRLLDHLKSCSQHQGQLADLTHAKQDLEALVETLRTTQPIVIQDSPDEDRMDGESVDPVAVDLPPSGVSKRFLTWMSRRCHVLGTETAPKAGLGGQGRGNVSDVLQVLASSLPHIVPNVIIAKRDELIPLLLVTILMHPDSQVRDQFLNLLFNLIKRPEPAQREKIIRGFQSMAMRSGPGRIEAELLPQCWEQIGHKYEERRVLVAETCGQLMPFIPSQLRSSLLLSMLQQMALEDREAQVRVCAIRSLAMLALYLEDESKFEPLWQLTSTLLLDAEPEVVEAAQNLLLIAMAHVGMQFQLFESRIAHDCLTSLKRVLEDASTVQYVQGHLATIAVLMPFVIYSVISHTPKLEEHIQNLQATQNCDNEAIQNLTFQVFFDDSQQSQRILAEFQEVVSQEWIEKWPELNWFLASFLDPVLECLARIPFPLDESPKLMGPAMDLVMHLVDAFGPEFAARFCIPLMEKHVKCVNPDNVLRGVGALCILRPAKSESEMISTLRDWLVQHLHDGHSTHSLNYVVRSLSKVTSFRSPLAEMAWSLVTDVDRSVRDFSGKLFVILAHEAIEDDTLIGGKILPGLVTLSSDQDETARISALPGLGIIMAGSIDSLREKAVFQFLVSLEEGESARVFMAVLNVLGTNWKDLPIKMREDILLPQVAQFFSKFSSNSTGANESDADLTDVCLSLLELYETVTHQTLTTHSAHSLVLPSLDLLSNTIQSLAPAARERVNSLATKLESIYGLGHGSMGGGEGKSPSSHGLNKMVQSPSLDEMKQKMGKLFHKPGGQVPFWKKSSG